MSKLKLYAQTWTSCTWRVRISLAYKGIPYQAVPVDYATIKDEFAEKINPAGQIPVLDVDGNLIAESKAILEYLEERYPEKPLLPTDLIQRAKVREICDMISTAIQPLQNPRVAGTHSQDPEKKLEWMRLFINRGFIILEKILTKTSTDGKFCFGNSLTLADLCLAPQVYEAVDKNNIDMAPYPTILSIYKELMKLDVVSRGHPDNPL